FSNAILKLPYQLILTIMKKLPFGVMCAVAASMLLLTAPIISVRAFSFETDKSQGTGSLTTAKGNHYVGGGALNVTVPVAGDQFVAGGNIAVQGSTTADLFVAGGNISLLGAVGDDARVAGGSILVSNKIGGDLMAAGGQIQVGSSAI